MHGGRGYRGWMAATTVAVTLSLVFLVVEKHVRLPMRHLFRGPSEYNAATTTERPGILLTVDPGLAGTEYFPRTDRADLDRNSANPSVGVAGLLRRPPEPAANVILQAPVALEMSALSELPLHASPSGIEYLMDAMDRAFESPLRTASAQLAVPRSVRLAVDSEERGLLPSPASTTSRMPEPIALYEELELLQSVVDPRSFVSHVKSDYASRSNRNGIGDREARSVAQWIERARRLLDQVVKVHGLEHPASVREIEQLTELAAEAPELGHLLTDYDLASRVLRIGYALQRRVSVWQAIQRSLDGTSIALSSPRSPLKAQSEMLRVIAAVEAKVNSAGNESLWREYLLLEPLRAWAESADSSNDGQQLIDRVLARLHRPQLTSQQRAFLAQAEFQDLASHLIVWNRKPVGYRTLLSDLEQLEREPISRIRHSLAGSVQVLRLSGRPEQQLVASTINAHYRNANLRLSVSDDLLQRFLPDGEYEVRPVRQRILGADTRGDSSVKTNLQINLIPDGNSWNIGLGVTGDVYSNTKSSKGPAVFHSTSTAQINSRRYIRLGPNGYQLSSEPTNVASQDYLRKMSTDFDGLPVIGDFVRLLVREQFDQKRGLAQRITRRLIAQETDAELDRRIDEGLALAERQLEERLVGPLEAMNLNPMVVAMNTTEDRLTIRYRVANGAQMAAHTPRPRAPQASLMSVQLHQSALNNAITQIGLSGKTWTLPELYQRLGRVFQGTDWKLPDDIPQDILIRFADSRPATVELENGRLRLTLRIAELTRPGHLHIERFIVSSNYIPVADGMTAELLRDGIVEIISRRDRLALRLIFAKVFVSRPEIPLISEAWKNDERAEGLAVSQLDIRDGWLAVAISEAGSEQAAEVAARARKLKLR